MQIQKVVFIGAGNLATRLSIEMNRKGFEIIQVFSKTIESAKLLADQLSCDATSSLDEITRNADLYIFSVKDAVLEDVLQKMPKNEGIWVHTAGSIPMDIFNPYTKHYGVFYPLQTFSKNKETDFSTIPFFIEANNQADCELLMNSAHKLSSQVIAANSEQRKYLHLAAVFACNFANHMYHIAADLVEQKGLPFEALQPLIAETASKIQELSPKLAQTGPAIRYDENVIERHIALLENEQLKDIYRMLSKSIFDYSKK